MEGLKGWVAIAKAIRGSGDHGMASGFCGGGDGGGGMGGQGGKEVNWGSVVVCRELIGDERVKMTYRSNSERSTIGS